MNIRPMTTPADWVDSEIDWAETHTKLSESELDRFIADRQPLPAMPAEACTEIGAHASPAPHRRQRHTLVVVLIALGAVIAAVCIASYLRVLRWQLACLRDEQRLYVDAGHAGPIFERNTLQQQLEVMARIRQLEKS